MAITALPALDRTSATFRADINSYFETKLPTFSTEINALIAEVEAATLAGTARPRLQANRTYYVATTGNDGNNGLAVGTPYLTINKAVNTVAGLDVGLYDVVIQVADGTYTTPVVLKSFVGSGSVTINGNSGTPANVLISAASADAIYGNTILGNWAVANLKVQTTTSGNGIQLSGPTSTLSFSAVTFGACATGHILTSHGAVCTASGNFAVSGNSVVGFWAARGALLFMSSRTITYSNSPVYSARNFSASQAGILDCYGMTFTNGATVTGTRYLTDGLAQIFTNGGGASYVPGNVAGSPTNGGIYY